MLAFLHTATVHVDHFSRLVQEEDASVPTQHAVREELLTQALADGKVTEATRERTQAEVRRLVEEGARVVVCTCSTLGGAAEATTTSARVLRGDRPMAERAAALGRPILLVAATPTSMATAVALLREVGAPSARELLCSAAWPLFERGDHVRYTTAIAEQVQEHARPQDVVVLAQASMTNAASRIARADVEVLTSPRLAVRAALALLPLAPR